METTEHFPALQDENAVINAVSAQRQLKSLAEHDCGVFDEKHVTWGVVSHYPREHRKGVWIVPHSQAVVSKNLAVQ